MPDISRREAIATATAAAAAVAALPRLGRASAPTHGRIQHSVCRWCYGGMSLPDLCKAAKDLNMASVELLTEKEWSVPASFGLTCAVGMGPTSIGTGFNRPDKHDEFVRELERLLPAAKSAHIPQVIVFSGNRAGMPDDEGLRNCAAGLKRVTPLAESLGVTIIMELLNSKRDHKDYMCDHTPWGVNLVKEVASDRFRLLYDIYHMQIMEGDVIDTLMANLDSISHLHTGGVPGRAEIDETQELNYRAICTALVNGGYQGYLGQEFIPRREPIASLRQGVEICTV